MAPPTATRSTPSPWALHTITATYSGDSNFLTTTSTGFKQTVQKDCHHDRSRVQRQPVGSRPVGDLHGHRLGERARRRHAHGDGHLQGRINHPGLGHPVRGSRHLHDLEAVDGDSFHHGGLRWQRVVRDQHLDGPEPGSRPVPDQYGRHLIDQPDGVRPVGDVHGHRDAPPRRAAARPPGRSPSTTARTSLGTGTLNSSRQATLTTSTLGAGTHTITAAYGGDTNFLTSTSPRSTRRSIRTPPRRPWRRSPTRRCTASR